jgi:hypothetical protein
MAGSGDDPDSVKGGKSVKCNFTPVLSHSEEGLCFVIVAVVRFLK